MDDQERFIAFLADIERAKRLVQVTTEARVESAEVRSQAMAQTNHLQSYYYLGGLFAMLAAALGWLWKMNGDTANNSRDIDVIRDDLKKLSQKFDDYRYEQATKPK